MIKKIFLSGIVCFALTGVAQAEIFSSDSNVITLNKEGAGGGKGTLYGKYAFTRDMPAETAAIRELGFLTLQPGDSVGYHKHVDNEDAYIIISGTGLFVDADGKEYPVKAGDMTIARMGQSHGITNNGTVPLVFIAVIAKK